MCRVFNIHFEAVETLFPKWESRRVETCSGLAAGSPHFLFTCRLTLWDLPRPVRTHTHTHTRTRTRTHAHAHAHAHTHTHTHTYIYCTPLVLSFCYLFLWDLVRLPNLSLIFWFVSLTHCACVCVRVREWLFLKVFLIWILQSKRGHLIRDKRNWTIWIFLHFLAHIELSLHYL